MDAAAKAKTDKEAAAAQPPAAEAVKAEAKPEEKKA
jgi:hypothetical protein